jgi:DUF2934 family protein
MATARKPTAIRARTEKRSSRGASGTVSADERALMIAREAYHRAERRGFVSGHELEDWLAAEREVNHLLGPPAPSGTEDQD